MFIGSLENTRKKKDWNEEARTKGNLGVRSPGPKDEVRYDDEYWRSILRA